MLGPQHNGWRRTLASLASTRTGLPSRATRRAATSRRWWRNWHATPAPARAKDLTGLPPAYVAVAGYDPLRDDVGRYAELLAAAGVFTQVHNAETLIHGYLGYAGVVPAATDAMARGLSALCEALHAT